MRTLEEIFKGNTGRRIGRHNHVLQIYDEHFARYRNTPVRFLEIGITGGGSLLMWKEYFGPQAKIWGLDVSTTAIDSGILDHGVGILTADQGDPELMKKAGDEIGPIDIVVDDGSHIGRDQIASFEALFPAFADNGIYAIEDLHTAYRHTHEGGYKDPRSIIEYTKNFPDMFHYSDIESDQKPEFPTIIKGVHALHYFRNVLLIEKHSKAFQTCSPLLTGEGTIKDPNHEIKGNRFNV